MAGGFRSKLDQSLDELVQEEITEKEKRKSSRYSPYPTSGHSDSHAAKSRGASSNSVYVGNLTYSISEDELRHHMSKGMSYSMFNDLWIIQCCVDTQLEQLQKLFYLKSQEVLQRYLCKIYLLCVLTSHFVVQGCG